MKIAVIGSGAMGCLDGAYLSKDNEVIMIDGWKDNVEKINENGITLDEENGSYTYKAKAYEDSRDINDVDLVIVFVKSINTISELNKHKNIFKEDTIVLTLQNGYGNDEDIMKFVKKENIIIGTSSHSSIMVGPGHAKHAGCGTTHISTVVGNQDNAEKVAEIFNKAGFITEVNNDVKRLIWSKLFVNIAINPLTTILKMNNGAVAENDSVKEIAAKLVKEAVIVANKEGMNFTFEEAFNNALDVSYKTRLSKSSMYQDTLRKAKTEIDKINGTVVRLSSKYNIECPYNSMICDLVHAIESEYIK